MKKHMYIIVLLSALFSFHFCCGMEDYKRAYRFNQVRGISVPSADGGYDPFKEREEKQKKHCEELNRLLLREKKRETQPQDNRSPEVTYSPSGDYDDNPWDGRTDNWSEEVLVPATSPLTTPVDLYAGRPIFDEIPQPKKNPPTWNTDQKKQIKSLLSQAICCAMGQDDNNLLEGLLQKLKEAYLKSQRDLAFMNKLNYLMNARLGSEPDYDEVWRIHQSFDSSAQNDDPKKDPIVVVIPSQSPIEYPEEYRYLNFPERPPIKVTNVIDLPPEKVVPVTEETDFNPRG